MSVPFTGLVPAALTPFDASGELNLSVVEQQAGLFVKEGVAGVFVGGTTGEFSSLSFEERLALTARWAAVLRGTPLRLVVHVGANCLRDSRQLATHAESVGAASIAMIAPSYLKPRTSDALIECCKYVASAAPGTAFYYYDIPGLTGVAFPVADWIEPAAARIPTLTGVKFTNPDLMTFQRLIHACGGRFDVLFGMDEQLLAAVALGGRGAVGSGYNFAAPLFLRLLAAVVRGDHSTAQQLQFSAVELIAVMARIGYLPAAKELMRMRGVELGPVRLPLTALTTEQLATLRETVTQLGNCFWNAD
jgi:N-acetylneuraminate lyase